MAAREIGAAIFMAALIHKKAGGRDDNQKEFFGLIVSN
jgi:hypothetical protein